MCPVEKLKFDKGYYAFDKHRVVNRTKPIDIN